MNSKYSPISKSQQKVLCFEQGINSGIFQILMPLSRINTELVLCVGEVFLSNSFIRKNEISKMNMCELLEVYFFRIFRYWYGVVLSYFDLRSLPTIKVLHHFTASVVFSRGALSLKMLVGHVL